MGDKRDEKELNAFGAVYIPLPALDDGVIRVGDVICSDYGDVKEEQIVTALIFDGHRWDFEFDNEDSDTRECASIADFYRCSHHVRPRTLEDVLRDVAYLDPVHRYPDWALEPIIARYAEEIRELLGVGE